MTTVIVFTDQTPTLTLDEKATVHIRVYGVRYQFEGESDFITIPWHRIYQLREFS